MKEHRKDTLHDQIADRVITLIQNGSLKQGDKVPSIRKMSSQLGVSMNTVKQAYWELESRLYIEAVPQSGFYVKFCEENDTSAEQTLDINTINPSKVSLCSIYAAFKEQGFCHPDVQLGIAATHTSLWPSEKLYKYYQNALRHNSNVALEYCMTPGYRPLREQIALKSIKSGMNISADDIIITSGCSEALYLALQAVTQRGDTIAIESPVYFNILHSCELLGLNVVEIPKPHDTGFDIEDLKRAYRTHDIKAILTIPAYSNPTGICITDETKAELVQLCSAWDIPLIEDGIYAELSYSGTLPASCKSWDTTGNVIHCSSFSKTMAPGMRVGWIIPGKYYNRINSYKSLLNIGSPALGQMAAAQFLKDGGFERYLKKLREALEGQVRSMRDYILGSFPGGTQVSDPSGGFVLWIKLPEHIDTLALYHRLLKESIIIAPGAMFTMSGRYSSCMRLNAGTWNEMTQKSLKSIADIIASLAP